MKKNRLATTLGLFCAVFALSGAIVPCPAGSTPLQTGLAYNEVTKIVIGQSAPEPGTFAADFQSATSAQTSAPAHHGLFGGVLNTLDTAKNALSIFKSGTAGSKYYLAGSERSDDLGTQTATISKPREHQLTYLNLSKKTYRTVDTNLQTQASPPDPARSASGPAQPGSGILDLTVTSAALGARTIDGTPTMGYTVTFKLTESQSTGSCSDGTFQTSMVEYVSNYAEPHMAGASNQTPMSRPELLALKPGCSPKIRMHNSGGAHPPAGRLALWMLVTIQGGAPSAQGEMHGGFSMLIERGNVRAIGAADKNLFSVPPDFSKE